MRVTKHAAERFKQRFPGLDIQNEYAKSRRVGRKRRRRVLGGLSPALRYKMESPTTTNYFLLAERSGVVFVMDRGEVVITVLRLP